MTPMNRALVFLLLAPTSVAFTVGLIGVGAGLQLFLAGFFAAALFVFTLLVSMIAATLDGFLARAFPFVSRVPLIAIVGAMTTGGLVAGLSGGYLPPSMLISSAMGGAFCMGVCSLLSNADGSRQRFAS
jgi:hypothetical protein